jgi:dolichol-phosphate mannosyltransferase
MRSATDIPDISVIIPAFNEEASLPMLFTALEDFVSSAGFLVQFVFVDDGSSDGTADYLSSHAIDSAEVKLVKLSRNFGAHVALRAGACHADADYCMFYSVDMPEPVSVIAEYFAELDNGNDLVYSRRLGYRGSFGSRVYSKLVNRFIGLGFPEEGVLGIAFNQKIKRELNRNIEANSSVFFQIFSLGFKRKAIDAQFRERQSGKSKWTLRGKVKLFVDSFIMFSYAPIRAISLIGFALALVGFVWALFIVVMKLIDPEQVEAGWPTLLGILLIGFGVTNFALGIIAEYLVRTLDVARKRPTFVVDEVLTVTGPASEDGEG